MNSSIKKQGGWPQYLNSNGCLTRKVADLLLIPYDYPFNLHSGWKETFLNKEYPLKTLAEAKRQAKAKNVSVAEHSFF